MDSEKEVAMKNKIK